MANSFIYNDTTLSTGDMLNVSLKVREGEKTRTQIFTGLLIAIKGREDNKSFTIRKIGAHGIGVERIFPVKSPDIESITIKSKGEARRSKLFYLRERTGRLALRVKTPIVQKKTDETVKKQSGTKGRKPSQKTATK